MVRFRALSALCAVSTILSAAAVHAADLVYIPPSVTSPVSVADWSGFYMGFNAGFGQAELSDNGTSLGFDSIRGVTGGVQIGHNIQLGSAVVGVEADLQAGHMSQSAGGTYKLQGFGTVRGRLGMPVGDRFMPYITGGIAVGVGTFEIPPVWPYESTRVHAGWTAGAGVEAKLTDSVSLKAEYLNINLGPEVYYYNPSPGSTNVGPSISAHIVRAGFNYRF